MNKMKIMNKKMNKYKKIKMMRPTFSISFRLRPPILKLESIFLQISIKSKFFILILFDNYLIISENHYFLKGLLIISIKN
jgi:hypothetical protein